MLRFISTIVVAIAAVVAAQATGATTIATEAINKMVHTWNAGNGMQSHQGEDLACDRFDKLKEQLRHAQRRMTVAVHQAKETAVEKRQLMSAVADAQKLADCERAMVSAVASQLLDGGPRPAAENPLAKLLESQESIQNNLSALRQKLAEDRDQTKAEITEVRRLVTKTQEAIRQHAQELGRLRAIVGVPQRYMPSARCAPRQW